MEKKERCILHCDMNNFYFGVACKLEPKLREKAVAVCGSAQERHGIVLAKNERAKFCGVVTGESIWQAQQKCPHLANVPPQFDQYLHFSQLAHEICNQYTDQVESFGVDECWLDVVGSQCIGNGLEIAQSFCRASRRKYLDDTITPIRFRYDKNTIKNALLSQNTRISLSRQTELVLPDGIPT